MSLANWGEIYNTLRKSVDKYVSKPDQPLPAEKISLHHIQMELNISYLKMNKSMAAVIHNIEDDIFPYYFDIQVKGVSRIDDYFAALRTHSPQLISADVSHSTVSIKDKTGINVEEYVPTPTGSVSNTESSLIYTPARLLNAPEDVHQYTPQKICNVPLDEFNDKTYRPSQIKSMNRSGSDKSATTNCEQAKMSNPLSPLSSHKFDKRRGNRDPLYYADSVKNDSPQSKRSKMVSSVYATSSNVTEDLFGDLSDDGIKPHEMKSEKKDPSNYQDKFVTKRPTLQRRVKVNDDAIKQTKKSDQLKTSSVKEWLIKQDPDEYATRKGKCENREKISKSTSKLNRKKATKDLDKGKKCASLERLNNKLPELDALQPALSGMKIPTATVESILDLKDMNPVDLTNTFDNHKETLDELFNRHIERRTHRVERATDYSHISMHSILLTTNQVHAMVDKLRQVYTENEYPTVHHYLFWERMVPEWGLAVFMKLFKLNREDALDHLRKQEMLIDSTTSFDIS